MAFDVRLTDTIGVLYYTYLAGKFVQYSGDFRTLTYSASALNSECDRHPGFPSESPFHALLSPLLTMYYLRKALIQIPLDIVSLLVEINRIGIPKQRSL
jgi:hypothetical protein